MQYIFHHLLLVFGLLAIVTAQSVSFNVYPQQVVTGQTYTIAWSSGGQVSNVISPRNIPMLTRCSPPQLSCSEMAEVRLYCTPVWFTVHRYIIQTANTMFVADGTTTTFQWTVGGDYESGTNYALQLSGESRSSRTDDISIINKDAGLGVSGSTIRTPSPTATIDPAVAATIQTSHAAATAIINTPLADSLPTGSNPSDILPTPSLIAPSEAHHASYNVSAPAVAGIVIGIFGGTALIGVGIWWCLRRRRSRSASNEAPIDPFYESSYTGYGSEKTHRSSSEVMGTTSPHGRDELDASRVPHNPELYGSWSGTRWDGRDGKHNAIRS